MQTTLPGAGFDAEVAGGERFEFGENWRRFLAVLDDERIAEAQASLREMLGREDLAGLSFLDVGSGSGLFSLAATRLGAARVHSFDYDPASVGCTLELRRRHGAAGSGWTVERGSALDAAYVASLGRFDVVYAWGVLHHTGDMWTALAIAAERVAGGGRLFVSIYNDQGTRSVLWRAVKRRYNELPAAARLPYVLAVMVPRELLTAAKCLARGRPQDYVRGWTSYASTRGMSRWHDLVDWVGGYPFEVATPEQVLDFVRPRGFELERLKTCGGGLGCNQFVFRRVPVAMAAGREPARSIRGLDSIVKDLAGVTGARAATIALSLLTVVLTARVLEPEGYAVIAYMTLGGTLIMVVASGWTSAAVMRFGREELDRDASMRRSAWARAALTAPILVAASALLPALKAAGALPQELGWSFVWLTVALGWLFVVAEQLQVVLDAAGRMRLSAAAAAARQALLVAGLVAIAVAGAGGDDDATRAVAWLTVGVATALALGLVPALGGLALWPPRLDRARLRRIVVFSVPLIAFAASQYGMRSVDIVVLRAYGTAQDVGIYALAYQGYMSLQSLAVTATIVLIPLFVSLREAGREALVARYFERLVPQGILATSIAGGLCAPLVVLAVPVAFGSDFEDAAQPLALLVAALALFTVASLLAPILMLHERTRETSVVNVAALAVNLVADILLVGVLDMGLAGPAVATIAALALIVAGYLAVARRDVGHGPSLSPALALPLAAGILPAVLVDGAAGIALGFAGAAAATALVLWRLALFTRDDAELVARLDLPAAIRDRLVAAITRLARA